MKIIGITGKSGSGKTTISEMLSKKLNCNTIDIDKIGHKVTSDEKVTKKLCKVFGKEILNKDEKVDRKKLGNIVFSNKEKMNILTDITWNYMQNIIDEILKKEEKDVIILDWALLPISKYWDKIDVKILMKANDEQRKNIVINRDKITEEYFFKRESNSINYSTYKFDYIFENNYMLKDMEKIMKLLSDN